MSLREALREQWAVIVLTSAGLIGIGALFGLVAPDGRSPSGQAVAASRSNPAVSPVPASILNAGDE